VAQKKKEILRQIYLLEGTTLKLHFFYLAAVRFELRASGLRLASHFYHLNHSVGLLM
jgi:hypothetical protein